jgi:hypothetical protein
MLHVVAMVAGLFFDSGELLPAIVGPTLTGADGVNLLADRIRAFCGRNSRLAK